MNKVTWRHSSNEVSDWWVMRGGHWKVRMTMVALVVYLLYRCSLLSMHRGMSKFGKCFFSMAMTILSILLMSARLAVSLKSSPTRNVCKLHRLSLVQTAKISSVYK